VKNKEKKSNKKCRAGIDFAHQKIIGLLWSLVDRLPRPHAKKNPTKNKQKKTSLYRKKGRGIFISFFY